MDYILQSPTNCSKGIIKYVINCTNFPEKKQIDTCPRQTVHHLNTDTKNLVLFITKKKEETFQIPNF